MALALLRKIIRILNQPVTKNESGIALFMVISSTALLTILVTEFVYVAQMNARIADDGLDQIKAHYLAKNGLKLSLLRLKAYQGVKGTLTNLGAGAGLIPKNLIEKIWSFPFMYPIPAIPNLSITDREAIDKFQKSSTLEGNFVATIASDSNKTNLNMILEGFHASPSPTPSQSGNPNPNPSESASPGPSNTPSFNPEVARTALKETFQTILNNKILTDNEFADEYRGFNLDDLMDQIYAWADRNYQPRNLAGREMIPPKKAPFYSLNELHMVHLMDDTLFDLFSPVLTASRTSGINVNTIRNISELRVLVPDVTIEESKEFYRFRDDPNADNQFKKPDDFWTYAQSGFSFFRNDPAETKRYREALAAKNIYVITDEETFKIQVKATVGSATKTWEAWVTVKPALANNENNRNNTNQQQNQGGFLNQTGTNAPPPPGGASLNTLINPITGLQITFMRLL